MRILFIDGTEGFTPTRIKEKPCGGIITSLTIIPKYLASKGHDVSVLSNYDVDEVVDGVNYVTKPSDYDIVVYNRNVVNHALNNRFKSAKKIWWLHDIADYRYLEDSGYKGVDKIVALSQYCKTTFSDFYDIHPMRFNIIPNGVDKGVWNRSGDDINKNLYFCATAPIKGLEPLPFTIYNLKRSNPDAEIRIYSNQNLHGLENSKKQQDMLKKLWEAGATILDPIPQHELAEVMKTANAMLMPNNYPEICSNLLLQSMACGCPVVTSNIGSAGEFIEHNHNGLLTKYYPHDLHLWIKEYAELTISLDVQPTLRKRLSLNASQNILGWEEVCEMWNTMIKEI